MTIIGHEDTPSQLPPGLENSLLVDCILFRDVDQDQEWWTLLQTSRHLVWMCIIVFGLLPFYLLHLAENVYFVVDESISKHEQKVDDLSSVFMVSIVTG